MTNGRLRRRDLYLRLVLMGFQFRKTIKIGPFNINLSKSGVGVSLGAKGFRVGTQANGVKRATFSIPGTGIRYVKTQSGKKKEI